MEDIKIMYKDEKIAVLQDSGKKELKTKGKYCQDDITIDYQKPSSGITSAGSHCDENGKWHFPYEEWNQDGNDMNIELIPIAEDEEVIYYLCDCRDANSFLGLRIYASNSNGLLVDYGVCNQGVFYPRTTAERITNMSYYRVWLAGLEEDFIVIRVRTNNGNHIPRIELAGWTSNLETGVAYTTTHNSILMRYGRCPYASFLRTECYKLESDNILDFAKELHNETLTISNMYNTCYSLQRWRQDGWNIAGNKVTSMANMFQYCVTLCDTPEIINMKNWCTSECTSLQSTFAYTYELKSILDLSNWNLENVTTTMQFCLNAEEVSKIIGLETWRGGASITTMYRMFSECYSLAGVVDFSGLTISSNMTNFSDIFNQCHRIEKVIYPKDMDMSNVTTMANMHYNNKSLKEIIHQNTKPPKNGKLTSISQIIARCRSLKKFDFLKGADLSSANVNSAFQYCYAMQTSDDVDLSGCIFPKSGFSGTTNGSMFAYNLAMTKIDLSWFDLALDTSSGKNLTVSLVTNIPSCAEFYPPKNIQNVNVNLTIAGSSKLSHDSIIRIFENLIPTTKTATITLGNINKTKLTEEELNIARNKGWTIA